MEIRFDTCSDHDVVATIGAALDALTDDRLRLPDDAERLELSIAAVQLQSRVTAWAQSVIASIEADQVSVRANGTPTVTWLADAARLTRREAGQLVRAGKGLAKFPQVGRAALSGEVLAQQAEAITSVLADLPDDFDAAQVAEGEKHMCDLAGTHNSAELRLLSRHLVEVLDPDTAEAREEERQERNRKRAMAGRGLFFGDDGHGTTIIKGNLPTIEAEMLRKVIDAQAAKFRRGLEATDPFIPAPSLPQRRADALVWMVQHVLNCQAAPVHGGDRPRIGVTIRYENLLQRAKDAGFFTDTGQPAQDPPGARADHDTCGAGTDGGCHASQAGCDADANDSTGPDHAEFDSAEADWAEPATPTEAWFGDGWSPGAGINTSTGQPVPASVLRQWLCDPDILPIVLGGPSEILDVGKKHRLVTEAIRTALVQRDRGCVFPGCMVPPEGCHAHHIKPWVCGGETSLTNLALLCPHHHNIIEPGREPAADRWSLRLRPDGVSEIRPPKRVDKNPETQSACQVPHQQTNLTGVSTSSTNGRASLPTPARPRILRSRRPPR